MTFSNQSDTTASPGDSHLRVYVNNAMISFRDVWENMLQNMCEKYAENKSTCVDMSMHSSLYLQEVCCCVAGWVLRKRRCQKMSSESSGEWRLQRTLDLVYIQWLRRAEREPNASRTSFGGFRKHRCGMKATPCLLWSNDLTFPFSFLRTL